MRRIEAIERQRWTEQLARRRADLRDDEIAFREGGERDDALRRVIATTRRDIERLQAALVGRRPSAVVDRPDRSERDEADERRALARDEALHVADNVMVYLQRVIAGPDPRPAAARDRIARWLLRLDVELDDAELGRPQPSPRALALRVLSVNTDTSELARQIRDVLAAWRAGTSAP